MKKVRDGSEMTTVPWSQCAWSCGPVLPAALVDILETVEDDIDEEEEVDEDEVPFESDDEP